MKRIVKNNLVLIVVLGVSALVTIGLVVWSVIEYVQMSRYIDQTGQLRSAIATLIKKKPAPVEGNFPLIESDTKLYSRASEQLRHKFGHPFLPAMDQFIAVLRLQDGSQITLKKFREDFFNEWNKGNRLAQKYSDYKSFQRRFRNWSEAMQAFHGAIQKVTAEPVTEYNLDEVFLSTLGVPREFDRRPENFLRFMAEYKHRLLEMTRDKIAYDNQDASNFSFDITGKSYNIADYPMLARQWEIVSDIVKRAGEAGIHSFIAFRRRSIQPEKSGSFDIFHYSIELTGTMESIRKFVTLLDRAVQDNRMYVVRSIFLYQIDDGAAALFATEDMLPVFQSESEVSPPRGKGAARFGRRSRQPEARSNGKLTPEEKAAREAALQKRREEEEKSLPYNLRSNYGKTLIGNSDLCRAIIDVEYIMESDNGVQ